MSASSRSTIFSLRSKKSKDSAEFPHTHAGPAYDDLPMAPRPPISVPTIIPPSQIQMMQQQQQNGSGRGYYGDEDESDSYSVKSEPRNGYGGMRGGGSLSAASLTGAGGVTGPRPLPPRSGSAEKIHEVKYMPLGQHESPNVPVPIERGYPESLRNYIRNERPRIMDQRDHDSPTCLPYPIPSAGQCLLLPSAVATTHGHFPQTRPTCADKSRSSIYSYLSVTPNGDVHLDRPKDDKVVDELFNDLMVLYYT